MVDLDGAGAGARSPRSDPSGGGACWRGRLIPDGQADVLWQESGRLIKQCLSLERDHVALLTSYLPRFETVLPPRKVARLYQVENKARASRKL
jgi:hypothetical protein